MELINQNLDIGACLLTMPTKAIKDLFQAIIASQMFMWEVCTNVFTIQLHNSPYYFESIKSGFTKKDRVVTLGPVYVKSLSQTSSFVSCAEFVCRGCFESFSECNDLIWSTAMQNPYKCRVVKSRNFLKELNIPNLPYSTAEKLDENLPWEPISCDSNIFDLLEDSIVYSDYQEFIASDGKIEILVIVQGCICNTFKIGECLELTGIYVQRWNQQNEPEYAFICYSVKPQASKLVKVGLHTFQQHLKTVNDFDLRQTIVRSSFSLVYGNYHIKLALLLNMIGYMSGEKFSTLILGDISCGKSTLACQLHKLFPENTRIINGALTNTKVFSTQKIMNYISGKFETGLLDDKFVLIIDNFQDLPDKKILYKAMESRSVIAFAEKSERSKEFNDDLSKNKKLISEFDRFDIILTMKDYESDNSFRLKKLGNFDMEDFNNFWDFDTIKGFLFTNLKNHEEIKIYSQEVEKIFQNCINYIISYNLKHCDMPVASGVSVRLLESLIKIGKMNAMMLGHEEITAQDAIDANLLLSFIDQPSIFVDFKEYEMTTREMIYMIENFS